MASRLCCAVLLLACAAVSVSASRQLLQSTSCPVGCGTADGNCIFDSSANSYKCTQCQGTLVVNAVTGTCDVPPGRYADASTVTATDCPKGSFCAGGVYVGLNNPPATACTTYSAGLTTIGKRATSKKACVNLPGYSYSVDGSGDPSATTCPANTYGPGLRKQRACTPCAPGYTTDTGVTGASVASACGVPAGYFLKGPGQVAPCPMGEYKTAWATATSCTKCAAGVTTLATAQIAATACNQLVPGFYAATIAGGVITVTAKCPQKYYCAGGQPSAVFNPSSPVADATTKVTQCADGAWTVGLSSTDISQCLTPPGYKTTGGSTTACGAGLYRAEWTTPSAASACTPCGVGILAEAVDQITSYDISTEAASSVSVAGSAGACYINAGQGMYYSAASGAFRAVACATNNYGVASKTYGLSANPCRDCPANMITDNSQAPGDGLYDGTGLGFTSPLACVTKPGYGYNGRSSYQCRAGTYNAGNNYAACTACGEGLTTETATPATDQNAIGDCKIAPGYGYHNSQIQPCPVGYYNDANQATLTTPCTACATGLTTSGTGSTASSLCNVCVAGYGGASCATQCGGSSATYGPAGVDAGTVCATCPAMTAGFAFDYNGVAQDYAPAAIARAGASVASDCLASFAQIQDVAWYLRTTLTATTATAANLAACAGTCTGTCMFVTYNYATTDCSKYNAPSGGGTGGTLAFKAVTYADATAAKLKNSTTTHNTIKAKAIASGSYTFWKDTDITQMTDTTTNAATTVGDCLAACDALDACAGVAMDITTPSAVGDTISSCKLITGDTTLNTWKRGLTRAVAAQLTFPLP